MSTPLGSSVFGPFSESEQMPLKISLKRSLSQIMRQNDPQRAPPGTLKGGPNPSKTIKKSSLSRPGCLQVTSRGRRPPKYTDNLSNKYQKNTKRRQSMDARLYSRTKTKKWRALRPVFRTLRSPLLQAEYPDFSCCSLSGVGPPVG